MFMLTMAFIMIATAALAAGEIWLFWRIGGGESDETSPQRSPSLSTSVA